jgi:hypothetical protein
VLLLRGCRTILLPTVPGRCWLQHKQQLLLLEGVLLQQLLPRWAQHTVLALRHPSSTCRGCPRLLLLQLLPQQVESVASLQQQEPLQGMPVVVVRQGCWMKQR